MEAAKDLPSRRGSITGTQEEVADLDSDNSELFNGEDAELHSKHTASHIQK
jgi:hypothetical protein